MAKNDSALDAAAVKKDLPAGGGATAVAKSLEEQLAEANALIARQQTELAAKDEALTKAIGKPVTPAVPVELKEAPVYVVQETIRISWGGQDITLHRNQEVSDSSYGPYTFERMSESGVKLEPKTKKS